MPEYDGDLMSRAKDSTRCVFVVGCGRSGTTLVYEILCAHPTFSWISNWCDRTGLPHLALLNSRYRKARTASRASGLRPEPSEGYRVWDRALPEYAGPSSKALLEADLTPAMVDRLQGLARTYVTFGRGPVFLNKNTRNTRRIPFLHGAYPGAVFVHVLRSPLDVVSSLLEVSWWPGLELWTRGGATPESTAEDATEHAFLAAELWLKETAAALDAASGLPSDQYIEVRYEDIVARPLESISRLTRFAGVSPAEDFATALTNWRISAGSVGRYDSRLSSEQIATVTDVVSGLASDLGYKW